MLEDLGDVESMEVVVAAEVGVTIIVARMAKQRRLPVARQVVAAPRSAAAMLCSRRSSCHSSANRLRLRPEHVEGCALTDALAGSQRKRCQSSRGA